MTCQEFYFILSLKRKYSVWSRGGGKEGSICVPLPQVWKSGNNSYRLFCCPPCELSTKCKLSPSCFDAVTFTHSAISPIILFQMLDFEKEPQKGKIQGMYTHVDLRVVDQSSNLHTYQVFPFLLYYKGFISALFFLCQIVCFSGLVTVGVPSESH